jgi:hypothetical protein
MPSTSRADERKQKREAAKHQRESERRQAEQREAERREARRQEAREQERELARALDEQAQRRAQLLEQLRAQRRLERRQETAARRHMDDERRLAAAAILRQAAREQADARRQRGQRRAERLRAREELRDGAVSRTQPQGSTADAPGSPRGDEAERARPTTAADDRQRRHARRELRRRDQAEVAKQRDRREWFRRQRAEEQGRAEQTRQERVERSRSSADERNEKVARAEQDRVARKQIAASAAEQRQRESALARAAEQGRRDSARTRAEDRARGEEQRREQEDKTRAARRQAVLARLAENQDPLRGASSDWREPTRTPARNRSLDASNAGKSVLRDRLSVARLSAGLPWLRTEGPRLETLNGDPVILRGVTLRELDAAPPDPAAGFAVGAGVTPALLSTVLGWGTTLLRISINRSRVMTSLDYLEVLDTVIEHAARAGAYTMLSLRRLDEATPSGAPSSPGAGQPEDVAPLPDFAAIAMWRMLAERYCDEPAVLFDLYAQPHPPQVDDSRGSAWQWWTTWLAMTVAELRRAHPRALCIVAGLDSGADLSGFPLAGTGGSPIPNLVYGLRLSPRAPTDWPRVRALVRGFPVFVTEWEAGDTELAWAGRVATELAALGIGWSAAQVASGTADRGGRRSLVPTRFGALVQRELACRREILATGSAARGLPSAWLTAITQ